MDALLKQISDIELDIEVLKNEFEYFKHECETAKYYDDVLDSYELYNSAWASLQRLKLKKYDLQVKYLTLINKG